MKFILISSVVFLFTACNTKEVSYNILQDIASKKCDTLVYPPDREECQNKKSYQEYKNEYDASDK